MALAGKPSGRGALQMELGGGDATSGEQSLELRLDRIVMPGAARLPIRPVPKYALVASMRHNMIDHLGRTPHADCGAADAVRMLREVLPGLDFPFVGIATLPDV